MAAVDAEPRRRSNTFGHRHAPSKSPQTRRALAQYVSTTARLLHIACSGAYPRFKKWGDESLRARGTRRRGVGVRRGVPFPTGGVIWGGGYVHSQDFFSIFELKMARLGAYWELILLQ